ncbi:SRPBCC family protein [Pseudonocardia spinosispora]|uniref:SRPBCC family protein n=1 Tax=Pseudonocardia spinosispora TaxID=103441 RepID=UPI0004132A0E|nr:SRPBCC family protein [Pseudonocardia spinosispora]
MSDHYGELLIDGEHAVIRFVRHLPYPIEAVWAAITDPGRRAVWLGETTIDPRVDGTIETVASEPPVPGEAKRMTGRILVWDPPFVFEHEWRQRIVEDSVVRYELARDGAGTVLTFTHRGLGVRNAKGFAPGTHAFLDRLDACLAGTRPPGWSERYEKVAAGYPAW